MFGEKVLKSARAQISEHCRIEFANSIVCVIMTSLCATMSRDTCIIIFGAKNEVTGRGEDVTQLKHERAIT